MIRFDPSSSKYLFIDILEKYVVSDEARTLLADMHEKVAVIAVAGKYRTGKSFLLNRVILN